VAPLTDPFAQPSVRGTPLRRVAEDPPTLVVKADRTGRSSVFLPALLAALVAAGAVTAVGYFGGARPAKGPVVEVKPTPDVLVAIRDIARLEVTEVHVEKVVDLADKQKVLGFFETEDAMLLVAAGSATVGVDLEKLGPTDSTWNPETKTARLRLPAPEIFSTRLDPDHTYVYKRDTGVLAKRNEQLEARGRKEALAAVERAASEPDVMGRAKQQAERQLTTLLTKFGAERVEITWKD
jgi:hypothetical protein